MFKFRIGPKVNNEEENDSKPIAWEAISWIVFYILCFAYCARTEIVEIMK